MATYKVLQDIEAEDKILGPLTLKQFIFAIITIVLVFLAFFIGRANILLAIPWLLPIAFFGFMATPIGRDQPNDVWLASRIRFMIKPKKRRWDQDGMLELVTITVPKKLEIQRTDGLSQKEVKSRLSALSGLMDTRGWAVKGSDMQAATSYYTGSNSTHQGERLIQLSNFAAAPTISEVADKEDMLDPLNNAIAQRIDGAIKKQLQDKIETLKKNMQDGTIAAQAPSAQEKPLEDYSFLNQQSGPSEPGYATFGARVVNPGSVDSSLGADPVADSGEDQALLDKIHHQKQLQEEILGSSHEHRIDPVKKVENIPKEPELTTVNKAPDAILKQLGQANDLSVASLAKLAEHAEQESSLNDNDVISLH